MIYNVSMKIAHLLENEQAVQVFDRFLPGMRKMAESNPQAAQLSVEQLVRYARSPKANEVITALDEALNALNIPENAISPSERKLIERFKAIEAEEGKYDETEIEHYRKVIACCRAHGVEPIVTLHHFTSPVWLIRKGGWEAENTVEDFRRYAAYVTEKFGGELNYICTINEANMGLQLAAISRRFMLMMQQAAKAQDAKKEEGKVQVGMNFEKMMENRKVAAMENAQVFGTPQPQTFVSSRTAEGDKLVFRAHQAAKAAIKALYPNIKVGITLSMHDLQALPGGESYAEAAWEEEFRHYLPDIQDDDFLGVQNYTRTRYGPEGQLPFPEGAELTQMDYEFYPEALENVLRKVHEDFKGDLIVTENGVAVSDDSRRVLQGVENCVNDGIPVKGYMYWSLMDNFEWQKGFSMTFGLIAVDRTTMERYPKESLNELGSYRR